MTETDIAQLIAMNRQGFIGWLLGATPTQAPALPIWARIGSPAISLLNALVGIYLLLLAKWES